MRKVEQLTVSFLRQGIEGRASSNTEVRRDPLNPAALDVYLFGNGIASYFPATGKLFVVDAGWQSATTRSRLNALLRAFAPGYGITQRDWSWYLIDPADELHPWHGSATFVEGSTKG